MRNVYSRDFRPEPVFSRLPESCQNWCQFGNILSFRYIQVFDEKALRSRCDGEMVLSDTTETYKIRLYLKHVYGNIQIKPVFSGFAITDMRACGYEKESRYFLFDFDDDSRSELALYCEDITAELLE